MVNQINDGEQLADFPLLNYATLFVLKLRLNLEHWAFDNSHCQVDIQQCHLEHKGLELKSTQFTEMLSPSREIDAPGDAEDDGVVLP